MHGAGAVAGIAVGRIATAAVRGGGWLQPRGRRLGAGRCLAPGIACKAHHPAVRVGHPHQALKESHGAAKAAKQVPRQQKFRAEDGGACDEETQLPRGGRARHQPAPHIGRWQQVGEQGDGPHKAHQHGEQHEHRPPAVARREALARRGLAVPQRQTAAGFLQHVVEQLHQREMRAQPAAVEAPIAPRHGQKGADEGDGREQGAHKDPPGHLARADQPLAEVVDPQAPALAQHPQLDLGDVKAQQVERGCQQEQREEGDLERAALALHGAWA